MHLLFKVRDTSNVEENGLLWKHMSTRNFISKKKRKSVPGFKVTEDHLTLLGGSATGNFELNL